MQTEKTTVRLIHPHPLALAAVSDWLSRQPYLELCGCDTNLKSSIASNISLAPEMLIVFVYSTAAADVQINQLKKQIPALKILLATDLDLPENVRKMVQAGVDGLIDVNAEVEEWEWAIRSVARGNVYYGQQVMRQLAGSPGNSALEETASDCQPLSKRELEILRLVVSEYSTSRIADHLFISGKTVESHRRNLFQKLGVKNSVGLTKAAVRLGIV